LPFETPTDFEGAAAIYQRCRAVGVTPRGLLDCTIAHVALRTGATLLSNDVDLARVAQVVGIKLDEASLRPAGT
jgi:predicted nucleic acid-binding protein